MPIYEYRCADCDNLFQKLRPMSKADAPSPCAQCGSTRLKLLKIGAVVLRNTRRIRVHCSSAYPYQSLFLLVARRLAIE